MKFCEHNNGCLSCILTPDERTLLVQAIDLLMKSSVELSDGQYTDLVAIRRVMC